MACWCSVISPSIRKSLAIEQWELKNACSLHSSKIMLSDVRNTATWGVPVNSTLLIYNKLNSYSWTKDFPFNRQTHLRDRASKHLKMGELGQTGKEGSQTSRDGCHKHSLELTEDPGREENLGFRRTLWGPEHYRLSDQHIIWLNPMIRAETEYRSVAAVF